MIQRRWWGLAAVVVLVVAGYYLFSNGFFQSVLNPLTPQEAKIQQAIVSHQVEPTDINNPFVGEKVPLSAWLLVQNDLSDLSFEGEHAADYETLRDYLYTMLQLQSDQQSLYRLLASLPPSDSFDCSLLYLYENWNQQVSDQAYLAQQLSLERIRITEQFPVLSSSPLLLQIDSSFYTRQQTLFDSDYSSVREQCLIAGSGYA